MSHRMALVLFTVATLGIGLLIGSVSAPDQWYQALAKPAFNPPPWVFPPVWIALYVMVGVAGWRAWRLPDPTLLRTWFVQMILNFAWTPSFFLLHNIALALGVIVLLLIAVLVFIVQAFSRDRVAAWLFVPYAFWVAFATLLTFTIWRLN